jgi:hypothetical protein
VDEDKRQINSQVNDIMNSDEHNKDALIIPILISPDDEHFKKCYDGNIKDICWIMWSNSEKSLVANLTKFIENESHAKIEPLDFSTIFLIKSFIHFLDISFNKNNKQSFPVTGIQEKERVSFTLENKNYFLIQYMNNMIRITDENGELVNGAVKERLRKIINEKKLDIEFKKQNNNSLKTTQELGKEVIAKLKLSSIENK